MTDMECLGSIKPKSLVPVGCTPKRFERRFMMFMMFMGFQKALQHDPMSGSNGGHGRLVYQWWSRLRGIPADSVSRQTFLEP